MLFNASTVIVDPAQLRMLLLFFYVIMRKYCWCSWLLTYAAHQWQLVFMVGNSSDILIRFEMPTGAEKFTEKHIDKLFFEFGDLVEIENLKKMDTHLI